mmetsp:Transcript_17419/g.47573  ORF Transcript_17419/g.47573 Transcript_17419/m.47573 type:complete len:1326 (-) Transcript_17419:139-4116(-)
MVADVAHTLGLMEYNSSTLGDWISARIVATDAAKGMVQLDVKPGMWFSIQDPRLRAHQGIGFNLSAGFASTGKNHPTSPKVQPRGVLSTSAAPEGCGSDQSQVLSAVSRDLSELRERLTRDITRAKAKAKTSIAECQNEIVGVSRTIGATIEAADVVGDVAPLRTKIGFTQSYDPARNSSSQAEAVTNLPGPSTPKLTGRWASACVQRSVTDHQPAPSTTYRCPKCDQDGLPSFHAAVRHCRSWSSLRQANVDDAAVATSARSRPSPRSSFRTPRSFVPRVSKTIGDTPVTSSIIGGGAGTIEFVPRLSRPADKKVEVQSPRVQVQSTLPQGTSQPATVLGFRCPDCGQRGMSSFESAANHQCPKVISVRDRSPQKFGQPSKVQPKFRGSLSPPRQHSRMPEPLPGGGGVTATSPSKAARLAGSRSPAKSHDLLPSASNMDLASSTLCPQRSIGNVSPTKLRGHWNSGMRFGSGPVCFGGCGSFSPLKARGNTPVPPPSVCSPVSVATSANPNPGAPQKSFTPTASPTQASSSAAAPKLTAAPAPTPASGAAQNTAPVSTVAPSSVPAQAPAPAPAPTSGTTTTAATATEPASLTAPMPQPATAPSHAPTPTSAPTTKKNSATDSFTPMPWTQVGRPSADLGFINSFGMPVSRTTCINQLPSSRIYKAPPGAPSRHRCTCSPPPVRRHAGITADLVDEMPEAPTTPGQPVPRLHWARSMGQGGTRSCSPMGMRETSSLKRISPVRSVAKDAHALRAPDGGNSGRHEGDANPQEAASRAATPIPKDTFTTPNETKSCRPEIRKVVNRGPPRLEQSMPPTLEVGGGRADPSKVSARLAAAPSMEPSPPPAEASAPNASKPRQETPPVQKDADISQAERLSQEARGRNVTPIRRKSPVPEPEGRNAETPKESNAAPATAGNVESSGSAAPPPRVGAFVVLYGLAVATELNGAKGRVIAQCSDPEFLAIELDNGLGSKALHMKHIMELAPPEGANAPAVASDAAAHPVNEKTSPKVGKTVVSDAVDQDIPESAEVIARDQYGKPIIARQVDASQGVARTIVVGEDGQQQVFGENTVKSLLEASEKRAQRWLETLSTHQLRGLIHEVGQRLVEQSQSYHCRLKEYNRLSEKKHFEFFGLAREASEKELDAAYKALAKKMHPDKNGGTEEAKNAFQNMKERYEALKKSMRADTGRGQDEQEEEERRTGTTGSGETPASRGGDDTGRNAAESGDSFGGHILDGEPPAEDEGGSRPPKRREAYDEDDEGGSTRRRGKSASSQEQRRGSMSYDPFDRDSISTCMWQMLEQLKQIKPQQEHLNKELNRVITQMQR